MGGKGGGMAFNFIVNVETMPQRVNRDFASHSMLSSCFVLRESRLDTYASFFPPPPPELEIKGIEGLLS